MFSIKKMIQKENGTIKVSQKFLLHKHDGNTSKNGQNQLFNDLTIFILCELVFCIHDCL